MLTVLKLVSNIFDWIILSKCILEIGCNSHSFLKLWEIGSALGKSPLNILSILSCQKRSFPKAKDESLVCTGIFDT